MSNIHIITAFNVINILKLWDRTPSKTTPNVSNLDNTVLLKIRE